MISMIAAVSIDGALGLRGEEELVWKSQLDQRFFYKTTNEKVIVMGNNTFKSLGKPLRNRKNVVLSRKEEPGYRNGVYYYNDIGTVLENYPSFVVIGGESIYRLFMPLADEVYLTTLSIRLEESENHEYAYFPEEELQQSFYMTYQSEPLTDRDMNSGMPINIIFSHWKKGVHSVH